MVLSSALPDIALPTASIIGAVDAAFYEQDWLAEPPVTVDMTACQYVEVPSLVFLIARLLQRRRNDLETFVSLPARLEVRNFLRLWQFPDAVTAALGQSFRSIVTTESLAYFGEATRGADPPAVAREPLLPANFYPLQTFFAGSSEFGYTLAAHAAEQWQSKYVLSVLNKHLGGQGRRVSTHIVHEAVVNAIRHPRARILQTASRYRAPGKSAGELTIVVWDDGDSIVSTLRAACASGVELRPLDHPRLHRSFELRHRTSTGEPLVERRLSSSEPPDTDDDVELLISSLYPGITSQPGPHGLAHRAVRSEDATLSLPGMGLFVLANTAIDVFGGQLSIRCDDLFLNLKPGDQAPPDVGLPSVSASVTQVPAGTVPFAGTMLTMRIPLAAAGTG